MITKEQAVAKGYGFGGDQDADFARGIALTRAKQAAGYRARLIKEVVDGVTMFRVYSKIMKKTAATQIEKPVKEVKPKVAKAGKKKEAAPVAAGTTLKTMTEEMLTRIKNMMTATWQAIGADSLAAFAEGGSKKGDVPRATVIELVTDADRMGMYGNDVEAYETFCTLTSAEKLKIGVVAFPSKRYGA